MNDQSLALFRFIAAAIALLAISAVRAGADVSRAPRPNIVLIVVDDMGYGDVGCFNPSCKNRTPAIDRMAREGMKLTSFYAAPVCSPSRAQMMTGCYAKRVSIPGVLFPAEKIGLSAQEHSLPSLLKAQGYATMAIGKWHLGDQPEFLPTRLGFDHYLGLPYSNDMGGEWDGEAEPPKGARRYPPLPLVRDEQVIATLKGKDQEQLVQLYTDEAMKFLREHQEVPFFLYLPHTAVHVPIHPGAAFAGKSANGRYGDWVEEVDASTGRIFQTLHELKLEDKTLVIFTSDNGPWLTQHADGGIAGPLRGGKGGTYEGGVREPTVAWWPGHIAAGTATDAVTSNMDLLPTFVKLAGGTTPADRKIDGRDLGPVLLGPDRDALDETHFYFDMNQLQAVRRGPWKLCIAPMKEMSDKKPTAPASNGPFVPILYNLQKDIGETTDVAADHPEIVTQLAGLVSAMDEDLGKSGKGPGVRPPGRVENPRPLLMKNPPAAH